MRSASSWFRESRGCRESWVVPDNPASASLAPMDGPASTQLTAPANKRGRVGGWGGGASLLLLGLYLEAINHTSTNERIS